MKHKQQGFVITELLASFSILMMISFTLVPIILQLSIEQNILFQKRDIQSFLHDELQSFSENSNSSQDTQKDLVRNNKEVTLSFIKEDPLWKGCAIWNNVKNQTEEICLYYYPD
ncbi:MULTISPECIES: hypothetical protein [Paraliobacillus]|uniref:hypothetical protein n=1 Tax=Paraliobacillus TaxID=200903 RepID=UPI000DD44277|nr:MULTISPECIES: hypothetical protein [Paraliobacillus]